MSEVLVLSGSTSSPSRTAALAEHALGLLRARQVGATHVQIRNLPAEALIRGDAAAEEVTTVRGLIDAAHGILIATPVYAAGPSGLLKALLDLLPAKAFEGKVILPLAVGASSEQRLAIDYGLRPVLLALGGSHVLETVYGVRDQLVFTLSGKTAIADDLALRAQDAVQRFIRTAFPALPSADQVRRSERARTRPEAEVA